MLAVAAAAPELEPDVGPLRPVRVGIAGLGRMGVAHAAVLSMFPAVTLVGAVDGQPSAGRRFHGLGFEVPVHRALDALLDDGVDAVWICTPPDSHLPLARRCLARHVAVFVEKPLAQSLEDAAALTTLARNATRPVVCGYTLAFWPSFVAARELLRAGAIGAPRRAESSMFLSQVSGPQRGWMYDRARSGGGVVANVSSHLLFLLRAYFGMPTVVRASWSRVHTAVEDELRATLAMPRCPEVTFHSSWAVPGYPLSMTTIAVEGADGMLSVRNDGIRVELREARLGLPAGVSWIGEAALPQPARFLFNGEAYVLEDAHALRWMTGGAPPPITTDAALDVQRIMHALYASAENGGRPATVPA